MYGMWKRMDARHRQIPTIDEMYAFIDEQIRDALTRKDLGRVDYLLERRLQMPELRAFLLQMGAVGA